MKLTLKTRREAAGILVVTTDRTLADSITTELTKTGYAVKTIASLDDALNILEKDQTDVLLLGRTTIDKSDAETLGRIRQSSAATEVIILGELDDSQAADIARGGAFDSLPEPISPPQLLMKIDKALEHRKMKQELNLLRQHVAMAYGFDNIIGESPAVEQLKETARRIAPTEIPILITGQGGTGKELLARTIHHHSNRRKEKLVIVDCAAIPRSMLDEELFGGRNATSDMAGTGLLKDADGGTVYLKNVTELPLTTQSQLLRLFQYSEIIPIGAKAPVKVDLRTIAASTADISAAVAAGAFRKDLFNYLSVITLHVPPLQERQEDTELITEYILRKIAREQNLPSFTCTRHAMERLLRYDWPGNIRELENILKRAVGLCSAGRIEAEDIIFIGSAATPRADTPPADTESGSRQGLLADSQRTVIARALEDNNWNFTLTAQKLGIGRTTLWRKVKKYDLRRESKEFTDDQEVVLK